MLKIYLAGPDVFRPDAMEHGERLKALCAEFGFQGLYPLDCAVPDAITDGRERAQWIYRANIALIAEADCLLANLDPFRGTEPDSGTCFEVGYAAALGKPLYGHVSESGDYAERLRRRHPEWFGASPDRDRDGNALEDFGLPLNLMLGVPAKITVGGPREALERLAADVQSQATP
ncbi:Nucleoside 2-deoxyribosyltransferase [compost metagenome]